MWKKKKREKMRVFNFFIISSFFAIARAQAFVNGWPSLVVNDTGAMVLTSGEKKI